VHLDLRRASVFLDFDGTISTADLGLHLLERLGREGWRTAEDEYRRGEIGSRACLVDQWEHLPNDRELLTRTAVEIPMDPGAEPLVRALRASGAEVSIVSDGFGFYVDELCGNLGVPIITNGVDWASGDLVFPNEDRCCACSSCGTCKQAPIKDAAHRGRTTVLVGDGTSDRKAALLADMLWAKDGLARWCSEYGVPFHPFASLADVHAGLVP
jgi:2,3-diketo-5-methylthio-1-phosphopentane phosphatase